jgi:hypothetical protein
MKDGPSLRVVETSRTIEGAQKEGRQEESGRRLQSKTPAHLTGGTIVNTKQKTKQANLKKKISQDK